MCGIGGLIASRAVDQAGIASRMAAQLQHRGPDGAAWYHDTAALLVHTRLGIIDLETGDQPLHNEEQNLWLICNGEIYNHIELRRELERKGHSFYSRSDCEVILHLYEEYGLSFVDQLNGQFAFCLWDARAQKAILVRDRVGIAPLFYSLDDGGLWFASEIKAILSGRQQAPRANLAAFRQMLNFWAPIAPDTIFEGIHEVPAGEMLIFQNGKLEQQRYWDLRFPRAQDYVPVDEEQAAEELYQRLNEAVHVRLQADVPVAAYLSGGLDSAVISTLMRGHIGSKFQTFSLTFSDPGLDESSHQQLMAETIGTLHHSAHCDDQAITAGFMAAVWQAETPLIRTAPIPMGVLSALARECGARVVLTGEGADEILGGYDIFKEAKLRRFWSRQPDSRWRPLLLKRLYPYLDLPNDQAGNYLANFFAIGVEEPEHPLFSHQPRINMTGRLVDFMAAEHRQHSCDPQQQLIEKLPADFYQWSHFCQAQYLEIKTLMTGYLLSTQGDRMLMWNAVEGRFPFLDHHVIEYANSLHPSLKMRVLQEKYLLKKAMANKLPSVISQRHKQPYRAPMSRALFAEREPDFISFLLAEDRLRDYGYFDEARVALLLRKARAGRLLGYKDNVALVMILSMQSWHHQFIENFSVNFAAEYPLRQLKRMQAAVHTTPFAPSS